MTSSLEPEPPRSAPRWYPQRRLTPWALALCGLSLAWIGFDSLKHPDPADWVAYDVPNFSAWEDATARKIAFVSFLHPLVRAENDRIATERAHVLGAWRSFREGEALTAGTTAELREIAAHYRLDWPEKPTHGLFLELIRRVDVIPESLALAQSALETGWGTSMLAQQENNLFGMLCYDVGCGREATSRPLDLPYYEYATYPSPTASVRAYLRNLNTNEAYRELRDLRASLRATGETPTGHALAAGLEAYSDQGTLYIERVRDIIRQNDLGTP